MLTRFTRGGGITNTRAPPEESICLVLLACAFICLHLCVFACICLLLCTLACFCMLAFACVYSHLIKLALSLLACPCIYVALLRPSFSSSPFFSFLALSLQGEILEEASGGRGRGGEFGCLQNVSLYFPEPTQEGCRLRSLNLERHKCRQIIGNNQRLTSISHPPVLRYILTGIIFCKDDQDDFLQKRHLRREQMGKFEYF